MVERGQHRINKKSVEITLHHPQQHRSPLRRTFRPNDTDTKEPAADSLWTVKVHCVSQIDSMETMQMYFENRRRSGGGQMVEFEVFKEEDMAYMTFDEEEGKFVFDILETFGHLCSL